MSRHLLALIVVLGVGAVLPAHPLRAADMGVEYVMIVHTDTEVAEIDRNFVRDVYLKKATTWARGGGVYPIDLPTKFSVRDHFIRDVIRKTPAQLRNYWNQQIFSGKGVPPIERDSPSSVISYVVAHPGAIGYIPASMDPGAARVVRVK